MCGIINRTVGWKSIQYKENIFDSFELHVIKSRGNSQGSVSGLRGSSLTFFGGAVIKFITLHENQSPTKAAPQ